jgi:hypothetical protein
MHTLAQKSNATQLLTAPKTIVHSQSYLTHDHEVNSILQHQHTFENQAVQRLLQSNSEDRNTILTDTTSPQFGHDFSRIPTIHPTVRAIQRKLAINTPEDEYEHEADRVAAQVMRMPEPKLQRACTRSGECPKCQTKNQAHENHSLQTKPAASSDPALTEAPPSILNVLRSPGRPLDPTTRGFMETRFGHNFADIRIHTDNAAGESARAIGALAYASGRHIVFAPGQFSPSSSDGRKILAHELTHTIQQDTTGTRPTNVIQRQSASTDDRANDPNFLLCLALCELGIPPSLWRRVVNAVLSAVSLEYRNRLGDMRGSQEFESWRAAFTVMST